MAAVIEEWPNARILTTFGPWLSDPNTTAALNPPHYTFSWHEHPVVGAFTAGLLAGTVGTQGRCEALSCAGRVSPVPSR